ncbi:2-oxoglutarate dehydrogenase complex E2 component [Tieghemiomyces parasiticus]|uniref:dihydrolipoyllysine-residue succinyltransferase n=1 Tax=Tieghemiomyces parasiticus TaxID=78921 RepID=A0A9W8A0V8_9FUNG|nr:2-oxoglutarate dehydrogenase complex E2 component [Tieghemiomyces parasiticus]
MSLRVLHRGARPALRTWTTAAVASSSTATAARCYWAKAAATISLKPTTLLSHTQGAQLQHTRFYADKTVKVPQMAESITEGTLKQWTKQIGDFVKQDEEVATIETDKIDVPVNAPTSGIIKEVFAQEEDTVAVGADLFRMEETDQAPEGSSSAESKTDESAAPAKPEASQAAEPSKPAVPESKSAPAPSATMAPPAAAKSTPPPSTPAPAVSSSGPTSTAPSRGERRVKMSRMRLRIAERLKESQNAAASLTTFNEIDMTNLMAMRKEYKDAVLKKYGVKLGFMSAFVKASAYALREVPEVNASIEGDQIVYRDYADISVAVATPKGLVTPILRNADQLSFVGVEQTISELGARARDNKLTIEDMAGGTFTISNGGVFGSLYGTPIINLPQSAILGMHAIKERPVAVNGKVEIRPMMYVALTYDHRLIDGREAVTFLVKIKEIVEDPRRLLLEV